MDKKITGWLERKLSDDSQKKEDFEHYDNIVAMKWELPDSFNEETYPWVRKRISTAGRDIIKQSCNIFDTFNPKFEILPRTEVDKNAAERLERWGEFQMTRANQAGEMEPFRETLRHSVTYDEICAQVECSQDIPGGKSVEYPFIVSLFHPSLVHSDVGGGKVLRVGVVNNVLMSSVIAWWEPYESDKKIKRVLTDLRKKVDDNWEARVIYADYVEKTQKGKRRVVFFAETSDENVPDEYEFPEDVTVILDQETEGFVNWVIVKGSSGSILESLYKSGLIENQNFLDTLADSTIIRRAFYPLFVHKSATGKPLEVRMDADGNGVVEDDASSQTTALIPPPLDPGIREMMDRNNAKMGATSGVQNLSSIEATNVQSATLQSVIALRMMELEPYKRNAEKALAGMLRLMFEFVKLKGTSIVAKRQRDSRFGPAGQIISIGPNDFDPEALLITCELLQNTTTDWMQRANAYAMLIKTGMHIDPKEFVERLDFGDADIQDKRWMEEQIRQIMLQAFSAQKMGEVQTAIQAQQMAMQMQAQAQMQPPPNMASQQGQGQPAFEQAGEMQNPNAGGPSPLEAFPQGTRMPMQQNEGTA